MTRDDIIRMREECDQWAEWHLQCVGEYHPDFHTVSDERFAALVADYEWNRAIEIAKGMQEELQAKFEQTYMEGVIAGAAAEREACAKVAENGNFLHDDSPEAKFGKACAAAIRARGQA
jgi:hypothetical protein